jgi:hypothetical protein
MLIKVNSRTEVTTDTIRTGMNSVPEWIILLITSAEECSSWPLGALVVGALALIVPMTF